MKRNFWQDFDIVDILYWYRYFVFHWNSILERIRLIHFFFHTTISTPVSLKKTTRDVCVKNGKIWKLTILIISNNMLSSSHLQWLCTFLTGGNWQKWKRVFLTCPCHKIYGDEAVGLKSCKYTWKITKFVKMGNLGQYRENLIFCQ